jgi:hypothetical protein
MGLYLGSPQWSVVEICNERGSPGCDMRVQGLNMD